MLLNAEKANLSDLGFRSIGARNSHMFVEKGVEEHALRQRESLRNEIADVTIVEEIWRY